MVKMLPIARAILLVTGLTHLSVAVIPTTEIKHGVHMPMVNFGVCNHTLWLENGGRGIDTALVYGELTPVAIAPSLRRYAR